MNKVVTHVAVGVAGLGIGFGVGYLVRNHTTKKQIQHIDEYWIERLNEAEGPAAVITSGEEVHTPDEETEEEIPDIPAFTDHASELEEVELPPDFPEEAVETTDEFTVEGQYPAVDARAFVEQFKNRAVADFGGVSFPGQVEEEGADAEPEDIPVKTVPDFITVRDPHGPYVISIDDYMDPESDPPFTKVEMRWFAGDNVVVDSRDQQVPMSTVGQQNTQRFGEGTTDPSQVYIRNERLSIDIELTREEGLYLHEVLGQDFPDKSPVLKFRESDDS